jgi:hypothetical protein
MAIENFSNTTTFQTEAGGPQSNNFWPLADIGADGITQTSVQLIAETLDSSPLANAVSVVYFELVEGAGFSDPPIATHTLTVATDVAPGSHMGSVQVDGLTPGTLYSVRGWID